METKLSKRTDLTTVDEDFVLRPKTIKFEILGVRIINADETDTLIELVETIELNPDKDKELCPGYTHIKDLPNIHYVWEKLPMTDEHHPNIHTTYNLEGNENPSIFRLRMYSIDGSTKILDVDWGMEYL